ncbi:hypothetical protein MUK42_11794 [Musa troglodytarum]|uniref:Uncharacterized protein n=1 Tax=Musa troglodytarum TaxID=320322 RepID=A0A9E7GKX3_9LILI|nr:hypothetical protein MUK42_11794 [Musa troglodytarum]
MRRQVRPRALLPPDGATQVHHRASRTSGEPEGRCREQHGVRGQRTDPRSRVRLRRCHIPASETGERAASTTGTGARRTHQPASPAEEPDRVDLHGDG